METIKASTLAIKIYFETLSLQTVNEYSAMTVINLLSDMGGMLSLMMGMSVLSFVEFYEMFLEIAYKLLLKRNRRKKVISQK